MKSESIKELAGALSKAQGAFDHAKKDVANTFFKSRYADLASVIDAAKQPLADNGLSVVQIVDMTESGDMYLETMLLHSSGEFISGRYPIKPIKPDPQSVGSAITYSRRYAFSAMTGIAADDDDGNAASQGYKQESVNYKAAIDAAVNLEQLGKVWQSIPKPLQPSFLAAKDSMKAKLTPQVEEGEPA